MQNVCNRPVTVLTSPTVPGSRGAQLSHGSPEPLGSKRVVVVVNVDAKGAPQNAHIAKSSGNIAMDSAALKAAVKSKYAPAEQQCVPVAGRYLYRVLFIP